MSKARADSGFLLLEVLVAFLIAALALVVLLDGTSGALRATSLAGRYGQAVARARSHLAAVGGGAAPLVPGVTTGDDGSSFHWQIQITSQSTAQASGPGNTGVGRATLVLYRVVVTEYWEDGRGERSVQLTSARLGGGPTSGP